MWLKGSCPASLPACLPQLAALIATIFDSPLLAPYAAQLAPVRPLTEVWGCRYRVLLWLRVPLLSVSARSRLLCVCRPCCRPLCRALGH